MSTIDLSQRFKEEIMKDELLSRVSVNETYTQYDGKIIPCTQNTTHQVSSCKLMYENNGVISGIIRLMNDEGMLSKIINVIRITDKDDTYRNVDIVWRGKILKIVENLIDEVKCNA